MIIYDSSGRLLSVKDTAGNTESYQYNAAGQLWIVTDKRGNPMVTNLYDTDGRVSQQTLADGAIWQFSYTKDELGNVKTTTVTDPNNSVTVDTFNSAGYLVNQIRAQGKPEQQTDSIVRDGSNLVQSVTDTLGRITQFTYDGFGDVTSRTRLATTANAVTEQLTYDPAYQQLTSFSDPLSHTTQIGYDSHGNPTTVTDALGHIWKIGNDSAGRPVSLTTPLGKISSLAYAHADFASSTDPLSRKTSFFSDSIGRLLGATDALQHNLSIDYDPMSRVTGLTDALGGKTRLGYDQNGNLTGVTDPRNVGTHVMGYDSRNRVHTYTDPMGRMETYNYDGVGNLKNKLDRNSQTTSFTYDGLNRLSTVTYQDGSNLTLTWDGGNRLTKIVDSLNGTINRQYDGLDRLTQESGPQGTVNYQFDAAGRRSQMTVVGLPTVTYQFDAANRLTQVAQGTTIVGLTYDAANRPATVTLPNGIVGTATFDDANQLTALSYDQGSTHIGDLSYTYDSVGHRLTASGTLATLGVPAASVSSATYDASNRLSQWGATALTYDGNGNLKTFGSATYTWNARDQLTASSDGSSTFSYDGLGRRAGRTLSGVSTAYLWDGYNAATTSGTLNLSGVGLDDSYAQVASGGTSSNLSDGNGNTVALTSTSAAITTHYTYSPYGETTKAGTADTPSQFTGRENDGSSNLYYYRSRYYMPRLGRFVSEDPSRFFGGLNLYTYVGNDPLDRTDPSGNCPSCLIGALVEVGFEAYTGELNNAFSQAFEGNFGALAVSAGKIGVASLSGGVSTVAAAKAVSIVGKAYEAANIGRVATAVAKVETVAAVQAASGAASKVATNAVEGKPLGEGVGTAATVGAVVGTAGKYGGDAISNAAGNALGGAGSAAGANARAAVGAATKVVTGEVKKETSCTVKQNGNPC